MPFDEKQQAVRDAGIGSSEIAAVAGLSPWAGPHDIWQLKMKVRVPGERNEKQEWGLDVEEPILKWVSKKMEAKIVPNKATYTSKDNKLVRATPDGFVLTPKLRDRNIDGVAEAKNVGLRLAPHWEDPDEVPDGVPAYVLCQNIWEMEATGHRTFCLVGASIAGAPPRIYRVEYHAELSVKLQEIAEEFWQWVEKGEPPPVDDRNVSLAHRWLKEYYQDMKGTELVPATPQQQALLNPEAIAYEEMLANRRILNKNIEAVQARFMAEIKDAPGIEGEGWRATWKQDKQGRVDWKRVAEQAKNSFSIGDEQWDSLVEKCRYKPRRVFRMKIEGLEVEAE